MNRTAPICHICRKPILGRSLLLQERDYRFPKWERRYVAIRLHPACVEREPDPTLRPAA